MAGELSIGSSAINRSGYYGDIRTLMQVGTGMSCNGEGTITQIKIYLYATDAINSLKAGIFYVSNGNYKCRAAQDVGIQTPGGLKTINVSLAVKAGDFLGIFLPTSTHQLDTSNSSTVDNDIMMVKASGDHCVVDDSSEYSVSTMKYISMEGSGDAAGGGGGDGSPILPLVIAGIM